MTAPARSSKANTWSVPAGRVLGVAVRLHVSFLVLVVLVPRAPVLGWLALVLAGVLAHELAHCVAARRRGAEIEEIVLMPIGGVSRIHNLGDDPRVEAWVAVVGPLTSMAVAGALAAVSFLLQAPLFPPSLATGPLLARLVWANVLLGAFNLLPAFPMDGGRVLRSLLAVKIGPDRATHIAARVGRLMAAGLLAAGLWLNVWLAVIAVFVYVSASGEEITAMLHTRARGLKVADVLGTDPPVILEADCPAEAAEGALRHAGQGVAVVTDHGRYLGLMDALAARWAPAGVVAGALTDREAPVLGLQDALDPTAFDALEASGHGAVAVVRDGIVVGLLHDTDVLTRLRPLEA